MVFRNRGHAGELLAKQLEKYKGKDTVVLAIPRGGVVVGQVVAEMLGVPLDIIITRKIGAPGNPEFAIGAIGPENEIVLNRQVIEAMRIRREYINAEVGRQGLEMERRERMYRQDRARLALKGKTVLLVDDGVATGANTEVAIKAVRKQKPKKLILAVPVGPKETMERLKALVDELICLVVPTPFYAVGQFYQDFSQTSDEEVIRILKSKKQKLKRERQLIAS